jgi:hypothetical protein
LGETLGGAKRVRALWARGGVRDLVAALFLVALVLLFFWPILTPNPLVRGSFPRGDFISQFYAFQRVAAGQLSQGTLPLWNPYAYSGHPFLADAQAAVFYPPGLVAMLLGTVWKAPLFALEVEAIAHFCLAALFTYAFARRAIGQRGAALVAAVAFAFGGYLTGYPPLQLAILRTDVWLPLILLGLEVGAQRMAAAHPRPGVAFLGAGLALGLAILAGHPQSAMYVLYASLAYALFRTWPLRPRRRALAGLGIFVLAGLGLSAAQWLPGLEYAFLSDRSQMTYQDLSGGLSLLELRHMVLVNRSPVYAGLVPLILALAAIAVHRLRAVRFWAGLAVVALLLSLGGNTFVYSLFYLLVPGFALFRSQERAAFLLSFSLAMLAAYGLAWLLGRPDSARLRRWVRCSLVGALGLAALAYFGWTLGGQASPSFFQWFLEQAVYLVLLLAGTRLLLWWQARGGARYGLLAAALVLVVLDLFRTNSARNLDPRPPEAHTQPPSLVQPMQADPDTFRVYDEGQLAGNFGCQFDLEEVWGASPLRLERTRRLVEEVPIELVWRLLNVKYVVTWRAELNVPSAVVASEASGEATAYVHRLSEPGPRAWVVHQVEVIADDGAAVARLSDPHFAPFRTAIVPIPPGISLEAPGGTSEEATAPSTVRWLRQEPSHLVLDASLPAAGLLVLSEVSYPGWQARIDGLPVPWLRANLALRGIPVPAGTHRIEMVFRPWTVPAGLALSALTLVAAGIAARRVPRSKW